MNAGRVGDSDDDDDDSSGVDYVPIVAGVVVGIVVLLVIVGVAYYCVSKGSKTGRQQNYEVMEDQNGGGFLNGGTANLGFTPDIGHSKV